jgi:hypothetical protein
MRFSAEKSTEEVPQRNMEFMERYCASELLPDVLKEAARDAELGSLVDEVVRTSIDYSTARAKLKLALGREYLSAEERAGTIMERDADRRRKHNSLIDSVNIVSRNCKKKGMSLEWRDELRDRDQIGDWAARLAISIPVFQEKL